MSGLFLHINNKHLGFEHFRERGLFSVQNGFSVYLRSLILIMFSTLQSLWPSELL